jgi:hypothetical protein
VTLPPGRTASVESVNLFEPNGKDVLRFPQTSFEVRDCEINGRSVNLAEYVAARGLSDCHLPVIGDFAGAHIKVSMQAVDFPQTARGARWQRCRLHLLLNQTVATVRVI